MSRDSKAGVTRFHDGAAPLILRKLFCISFPVPVVFLLCGRIPTMSVVLMRAKDAAVGRGGLSALKSVPAYAARG